MKQSDYRIPVACAKQVMFSSAFVCLLAVTKFVRKVAHWPKKKRVDVGGNMDHVTFRLGLGLRMIGLWLGLGLGLWL